MPNNETRRKRIQRSRAKDWRLPVDALVVSRPSEFGNPFRVVSTKSLDKATLGKVEWWVESVSSMWGPFASKAEATDASIKLYRHWIESPQQQHLRDRAKFAFSRYDPACWCRLDQPCHADVLLELANAEQ